MCNRSKQTLEKKESLGKKMELFLQFHTLAMAPVMAIEVCQNDKTSVLGNYLEKKGWQKSEFRFLFANRQLDENYSFLEYNIQEQSTIGVVHRLRGD